MDGRSLDEYPPVEFNTGVIAQAAGSAALRMGSAHVLVGIKAEVDVPDREHPDEGKIKIGVDVSPCAAPEADARSLDAAGASLASHLQRLLLGRQSKEPALDLKILGIIHGRSCWTLYIDCIVLSTGGCMLDALSFAILAALSSTAVPSVSVDKGIEAPTAADIEVDDDPYAALHIDTLNWPVVTSVCQVGRHVLLGATALEEDAASSRMHVAVNRKGQVCGLLKAGRTAVDVNALQHLINTAQFKGTQVLIALQERMKQLAA